MLKNALVKVTRTQEFMNKQIPVIIGGFGEGQKVVLVKTIAEIHGMKIKHVNELINRNIKRFKDKIDILDLGVVLNDTELKELGFTQQALNSYKGLRAKGQGGNIYLLSERGYAKLIKIMDTDLAWEIHDKLIDEYFKLREAVKQQPKLTKKHELAIKIYDGGSDAIIAHKELVKIEVAEETARLKDGTNKILSAQQVVDMLGIRKLTTTLLHGWFVENDFGEWVKFDNERNRLFQPIQKFFDYVAVKGYSFTGKTVKGNKVKVVYSTAMVDRLLEKHMASIVQYVRLRKSA